jgi:GDP-L-fucose synthase
MKNKHHVMITGSAGLVGAAFKQIATKHANYTYTYVTRGDCDLLDTTKLLEYLKQIKPDVVIHLAANVGGLFKNMNQKVQMFEDNMLMNMNVLRACHKMNITRVIGALSTCIFPDDTTYPINEDMLQLGPPHTSNDAYAYAKRMLEVQCKAYNEQYNTNYSCIIPTNIYGDNDNYHLEDAHVIPALIHKCYLAKQKQKPFIVAGSGKPLRQFIHADDLANITLSLLDKIKQESVIISPDTEISIKEVATHIARAFEYEHMMEFDASLPDGQYKKTADNTKLKSLLTEYEFIDIKEGIARTVKYFIENYNNIRK